MIKHLIFDFDGVVADTFDVLWALAQEHDENATYEDFLAHHDGNVFEEPKINFRPECMHEFDAEYRRRIKPGHLERAQEHLRHFGEKYSLYIVSSNGEHGIRGVLKEAEMDNI